MSKPAMSENYIVEEPIKSNFTRGEAAAFISAWYRIAAKDGSTIAYVPDRATADVIAQYLNGVEGGGHEQP